MVRITGTEDQASAERSGLSPNPSPPGHRRTVTRNQISYQFTCLAVPQAASADILAGWYDFNSGITGDPTFNLEDTVVPLTGPGVVPDILATDVGAEAWPGTKCRTRGGSTDDTFGTLAGAAHNTGKVIRGRGGDGTDGGSDTLTFAITNNLTGFNLALTGFHFDFGGCVDTTDPITEVNVKYNSNTINHITGMPSTKTNSAYDYPDHDTTGLSLTLAPGATGTFTIVALDGSTGADQHYDNIAIVGSAVEILEAATIPEPMTMLAVGMGISGLGGYIRKRRRA